MFLFVNHFKHHIYILPQYIFALFNYIFILPSSASLLHLNFKTTQRERSQLVVKATDANGGRSSVLIGCRLSVILTDSLMLCRDWSVWLFIPQGKEL